MSAFRISLLSSVLIESAAGECEPHPDLEALAGRIIWDEELTQNFSSSLEGLNLSGGIIELVWSNECCSLRASANFLAPRKLSSQQIQLLLEEMYGQYSDGVGEESFEILAGGEVLYIKLVLESNPQDTFCIEQSRSEALAKKDSPLLKAAELGEVGEVVSLLKMGEPVNALGKHLVTPLILAVQAHHLEVSGILLAAGADVNQRSVTGVSPLLHAVMANAPVAIIELLIACGSDVQAASDKGYTPVSMAANRGQAKTLEILLNAGGDIDAQDANGFTPLMHASPAAEDVILLLLDRGCDPALVNVHGKNAIEEALEQASGFERMGDFDFARERVRDERCKAELIRLAISA